MNAFNTMANMQKFLAICTTKSLRIFSKSEFIYLFKYSGPKTAPLDFLNQEGPVCSTNGLLSLLRIYSFNVLVM